MATCDSLQWLLSSLHNVTHDCIMLSLRNFDIFLGMSDSDNFCTRFYYTLLVDLCRSQLICIGSFAYNLSLLILQAQAIIADCFSLFSHSAVKYRVTSRYWIPLIFQSDCIRRLTLTVGCHEYFAITAANCAFTIFQGTSYQHSSFIDELDRWLPWSYTVVSTICIILLHEKFLQFDWLGAVVFQLNFKYVPTCENYKPFVGSIINK